MMAAFEHALIREKYKVRTKGHDWIAQPRRPKNRQQAIQPAAGGRYRRESA